MFKNQAGLVQIFAKSHIHRLISCFDRHLFFLFILLLLNRYFLNNWNLFLTLSGGPYLLRLLQLLFVILRHHRRFVDFLSIISLSLKHSCRFNLHLPRFLLKITHKFSPEKRAFLFWYVQLVYLGFWVLFQCHLMYLLNL